MNLHIRQLILSALLGLFALTPLISRATEDTPVFAPPQQVAAPAAPASQPATVTSTKDQFLQFVLEKAKTYTGKAETVVTKAVDVAMQEGPGLVHEYLVWKAWQNGLKVALNLAVLLVGLSCMAWAHSKGWEDDIHFAIGAMVGGILSILSLLVFFTGTIDCLMDLVQIWVAPRIYIIEQVLHLWK